MPHLAGRSVIDWPEGLTVYDRDRACPGFTLLIPFRSPMTYLLDMRAGLSTSGWCRDDPREVRR